MTKTNYSGDASLLLTEVIDFSTNNPHPTEINEARMRLPERYDIAKFYRRNKIDTYSKNAKGKRIKRNAGEYGHWWNKPEKELLDFSDDFDWQITYSFPSDKHLTTTPTGKSYGAKNMTLRRLYLILCEHFNNGVFFVDEYFRSVYPDSWVKEEVDVELNNLKDELVYYASDLLEGAVATKSGKLDKRLKVNRGMQAKIKEWNSFAREWEERKGRELAEDIAWDIKKALENGEIPLNRTLAESTQKIRRRLGVDTPDTVFFAMGRLIDNIQLFVDIGGNGKWRTEQGILV